MSWNLLFDVHSFTGADGPTPSFRSRRVGGLSGKDGNKTTEKRPQVTDLSSAWLLLLFCVATRPLYILRVVQPQADFASADIVGRQYRASHKWPLRKNGLGLRSAVKNGAGACWLSWADVLHMTSNDVALSVSERRGGTGVDGPTLVPPMMLSGRPVLQCLLYECFW